ncbi:MAG: hypothetical protein Fur0028_14820 [Bacteroidales bacterium]
MKLCLGFYRAILFFIATTALIPHVFAQQDTLSDADKNYNLILAAYNGKVDSVLYWLNAGANPNAVSSDGVCVLNYAIQSGQYNSVKALVFNGSDVNYENTFS